MRLLNASVEDFLEKVRQEKLRVIFFGTGMLMKTWLPEVFLRHGVAGSAECCLDNDSSKWGGRLPWSGEELEIRPPEALYGMDLGQAVILIASSYFASIIDQLDAMHLPESLPCYVAPIMHITHPPRQELIPKVIHCCWFGKKPMPEHAQKCLASWRDHCPGYEIRVWSEENYDLSRNDYMREAYEAGAYGYVPDYARIDLLYRYGGFYLDTDVRLLRGLDDLRTLKGFTSFEEYPTINFGGGSGAVQGLPILKDILDFRAGFHFRNVDGSQNRTSCGYYETLPLVRHGLRLDGSLQEVKGLTVFPSEYFHPKSTVTGQIACTEQTRAIHDFGWSWVSEARAREQEETHRRYPEILKRMEGGG